MLLGIVKGTAICTMKYPGTEALKLLVVQPVNKELQPVGQLQVAADATMAGEGDLCVMTRSREASLALQEPRPIPIDLACVGVVDQLYVKADQDFELTLKQGFNPYA